MPPIEKDKKGNLIWREPTQTEIRQFDKVLEEHTLQQDPDLLIREKTAHLVGEVVKGSQRLLETNKKTNRITSKLAEEGIEPVDIVVPVHNAWHITKECLESVVERTKWPYHLIVVDDASDEYTAKRLESWVREKNKDEEHFRQWFYIKNNKNKGFAASVNRGVRAGSGRYVCILNSDVIVTENWMTKMIMALESEEKVKIVNPCTNNTAMINVPMTPGASYLDMNRALEWTSHRRYPEIMPTGFCFLTYRSLFEEMGYFDEAYTSYGEESDWWMRTITRLRDGELQRWRAALADDTYLFHERGTSFSSLGTARHMALRKAGSERFHKLWPGFKSWNKNFDLTGTIGPLRTNFDHRLIKDEDSRYNLAFVVHSVAFCGGMKMISDMVNHLIEQGINAKVVHIKRDHKDRSVPLNELRTAPIVFDSAEDFIVNFPQKVFSKGIVIASTNELCGYVSQVCKQSPNLTSLLYSQSHDPLIAGDKETARELGRGFSMVDHVLTNSKWLSKDIKRSFNVSPMGFVRPGVDKDLFYPGDRSIGDDRLTVLITLNNSAPYRGWKRGTELAELIVNFAKKAGKEIRVMAYGVDSIDGVPEIICLGQLGQTEIAKLLREEVDIFVDPSHLHTYGMPALEAIVSGVPVVSWNNHGINEYPGAHIFSNDSEPVKLANKIWDLLENPEELNKLKETCIKSRDAIPHRKESVKLFQDVVEEHLHLKPKTKRKIAMITPHMRKYGGPTTIITTANELMKRGHDVDLYTIYSDITPEILNFVKPPVKMNWTEIKDVDVLITNSDNPVNPRLIDADAKKKILLKLSHNPRFLEFEDNSLKLNWDAIITSTEWLKKACKEPSGDWTHPPREATKVGWYHYFHYQFDRAPDLKIFNEYGVSPINIGTLIHPHPLKGANEALNVLMKLKQNHDNRINVLGVGETPEFKKTCPPWVTYFYNLTRKDLTKVIGETDIWLSASQSEGLGRMALEAMSASCAIVMFDTQAEFAKHEENCLIVKQGDLEGMYYAVERLMKEKDLRQHIVKGAYRTAFEYSKPEKYIDNIEEVIEGLFNGD